MNRLITIVFVLIAFETVLPAFAQEEEQAAPDISVQADDRSEDLVEAQIDEQPEAGTPEEGPLETQLEEVPDVRTPEEDLQHYFFLYKNALEDGMYTEADSLAKRVVELSISVRGLESHDTAIALTNLGVVQHKLQDYESAQQNYLSAIGILERMEDRLHSSIVAPLKGLGATQLADGRPDLALRTFQRAMHITHVNEGPHNLMQIPVLDALAATNIMMGELDAAEDIQERIYFLQTRDVELDSEEALPALRTQADWSHRLRLFERERKAYRQMIKILEKHRGKDDLALIEPLTMLGNSFLYGWSRDSEYGSDIRPSAGDDYLRRALKIAYENPASDWRTQSDALLELADYYNVVARTNTANRAYVAAWELLSSDGERLEVRRKELESMAIVSEVRLPRYYDDYSTDFKNAAASEFHTGVVVTAYEVGEDGRPSDVHIVKAEPEELADFAERVRMRMSRMIHRPKLSDGVVVTAQDVTYTHEYQYRDADFETAAQRALAATGDR